MNRNMNWKKIIVWAFAVLVAMPVGLITIALLAVKLSPTVRREILARVERHVGQASGAQVAIRDFRLDLSGFGLQLEGIVVRKPGPQSAPPLLQIEHVAANIKLDSVFRRQWHLQSLVIDQPVVHVYVDGSGESNLPQGKAGGGTGIDSTTLDSTIFDLAIEQCQIARGEIYFNDAKSHLDAELYNLQLNAAFDRSLMRYHGGLSYDRGKVQYGSYAPVVHGMAANFTLTSTKLTVDRLAVVAGKSRIEVHGSVENFAAPAVQAAYDVQLSARDFAHVLDDASLPEGTIHAAGSLTYESHDNRPFLQNAYLAGNLSSDVLQVRMQAARMEVRNLSATYKLEGGNVEVQDLHARVLGGSLNGTVRIRDIAGASHARLQARLRDVSIEQIEAAAQHYSVPEAHLRGRISADTDATWGQSLADLVAQANATLEGSLGHNPSAPISGAIHGSYAAATQEIELRQSYVRTAATSLTLDGKVSQHSRLQVAAHSNDLHELELLAGNLGSAFSGAPPPKLDLHGTASFNGSVTGSATRPRLEGRLEARSLQVKGSSWKLLRANVDAGPSAISLGSGHLEAAAQGTINFNLRTTLDEWVYTPASPINLEVSAAGISLSDAASLANQAVPVSGTLSGNASVHGSQLNPVGHGDIRLAGGEVYSDPIQSLVLKFQGDGKAVQADLLARLSAGTAQAHMTLDPKTLGYQLQMQADHLHLERLLVGKSQNLPIAGLLGLHAAGQGTLSSPELTAEVNISQLRIQEQPIQDLTLAASLHGRSAEVTLNSVTQPPITGHCTVEIDPPFMADLRVDAASFSLRPLLALYVPAYASEVQGQTEFHASLHGPLRDQAHLEAHLEIPVLTATYHQLHFGAAKPIRADYRNGVVTLQPASFDGTGTKVQMQASVPVNHPAAATYLVEGTVDLSLARMLQPDLAGGGHIQIDLDSRRHVAGSDVLGEVRLVDATFHSADVPMGLDHGNAVLTVSRTRLEVQSFQAQVGGGTLTARGGVTFRPAVQFDLGLSGRDVRMRYPDGVRAVLESDLTLVGNQQEATLGGTVTVQRLSLTRDFDLLSFANKLDDMQYSAPAVGFGRHVRINVELRSASQVDVVSTKVSLGGNANLRLTGTAAEPVILGRANLNGGDLFLGGNRYVVQNGAVDFINPVHTEAVVNARIQTRINHYDITLILQGPMERLAITYTSEPPLPPADIINLIAFGQTTSEVAAGNPGTLGNLGAQSVIAQGLSRSVSSRVEKFAGLSYFSIDPALGGSKQNAAARVVIQERVTNDLVVTYSTDVTSIQRQAIQLEYRFNPRWSVSGVRDQNGGFGATANYHTSF
jgi:translocation and assembly module TamB